MTRPCGCTSDPVVFGHDHPGDPIPAIMRAIWRIVPARPEGATR